MPKFVRNYFKPVNLKVASLVLMAASLVSYVAGLFRDLILSYFFGANGMTDVYYTAFLVPDLVFNLTIAGVLGGVFIPVFRERYLESEKGAAALAGAFLISSQLIVLVVSLLAFIFMPWISSTFFVEASMAQRVDIVNLSRIMLVSPIIFSISNSLGSILMSFKHYLSYALSPGLYNLGIIIGIFAFHEKYGIYAAAFGVLIGLGLHLLVRFLDLINLDFKFKWSLNADGLGELYKLSIPKTLGLVVMQLSVWVYNIIGYGLVDGSITAYNYARNVQSFAVSLFGIAVATAVFPFFVDSVANKKNSQLAEKIEFSVLQILFFTIPAAVGLSLLSEEVTAFLFSRGEFDNSALVLTSGIMFFFAFSIPFESLVHLLSRVYYAFKNTWIPVMINILFLIVNIFVAFKFADVFGPNIFAISFSIGSFVQVGILILMLRKYISLNYLSLLKSICLIGLTSAGMGLIVDLLKDKIHLIPVIVVAVLFYFIFARFLGILNYAGIERFLNKKK